MHVLCCIDDGGSVMPTAVVALRNVAWQIKSIHIAAGWLLAAVQLQLQLVLL